VRAEAVGADVGNLPQVLSRRNGDEVHGGSFWAPPPAPGDEAKIVPVYYYAEEGDTITLSWEANGVARKAEHVHRTPSGCAEPKLSFSLRDDCGTWATLIIGNDGSAPIDLIVEYENSSASVTVPRGGTRLSILGNQLNTDGMGPNTVSVWTRHPDPPTEYDRVHVTEFERSGCADDAGKPDKPQSLFDAACGADEVSIVWINGKAAFEGVLRLYHNGDVAIEEEVEAGGIHQFRLRVAEADTVAVGGPDGPHGTYTHRRVNARCTTVAGPGIVFLPATGAAVGALVLAAAGLVGIGVLIRRGARRRRPQL
jgi:hypothetical protein